MKNEIFQKREVYVAGSEERLTVYSADGRCWWSNLDDYARYQLRRRTEGKKLIGPANKAVTLEKL